MTHRLLKALSLSFSLLAGTVNAQSEPTQTVVVEAPPRNEAGEPLLRVVTEDGLKAEYAARLLAVTVPDLEKFVREAMAAQFANLSSSIPAAEAAWLRKTMAELTLTHIRTFVQNYERLYAQNFTLEELSALIAFRETEMGQSISRKELGMGPEVARAQFEMQQAMTMDFFTRYCQQFSCDDKPASGTAVAPKSNRH